MDIDPYRFTVQVSERWVDRTTCDVDKIYRQTDTRTEVTNPVSWRIFNGVTSQISEHRRLFPVIGHDGTTTDIQGIGGNADSVGVMVGVSDAISELYAVLGILTVEPCKSLVISDLQSQFG